MTDRLSSLWQQRYRSPLPAPLETSQNAAPICQSAVLESLLSHRSVRAYRPDALPEGTLEAAIAAAQSAATSSNLQCWSVIAIESPERREVFAQLCGNQAHIAAAPLFLVWLADISRLERLATQAGQPAEALDYTESFLIAAIDAALAAQNAVAAFEAAGLGTVYIGGLRNHPLEVAKELDLPKGCVGLFGLCVGYEDETRPASIKPRLPQRAVLHRDRYDTTQEAEAIASFDAADNAFQQEQSLPPRLWSEAMVRRIVSREGLHGRDTLLASLKALGFPMK
ncbi:nitroreductase family protein [Asaia bogorensis]|uniref:nitroreductase family protein n=1 Tax=Asaia bogorensis TaxID=91915 RepID=UPI000EFCF0F1|nr:nitroreductase family protein [Asaia bogorensis]